MLKNDPVANNAPLEPSELIVTDEGAMYHINLRPDQIADTIILVGDQGRVARISNHFDEIEHKVSNREFVTHTGTCRGKRLSVISTGIGTDNVDIVLNEVDALVNIDLHTRMIKEAHTSLKFIRLGTSGALQEDIPVDSFVLSSYGLGFDGLLGFYAPNYEEDEISLQKAFLEQTGWRPEMNRPYFVRGSQNIADLVGEGMIQGITATANGFYGPQGRILRLPVNHPGLNDALHHFNHNGHRITNFEMETSGLYGLAAMLGHEASTVCAIIANRFQRKYSEDYKKTVDNLIETLLARLTA